jgi:hypothetical protein
MEVTVLKFRTTFCKLQGIATVNGEVAAEATLRCMLVDRDAADVPSEVPADAPVGAKS